MAAESCTSRFRAERRWANEILLQSGDRALSAEAGQIVADAEYRLYWLPGQEQDLLPTELGNTLRVGEIRAGERYGLVLDVAMARLSPLLSPATLDDLGDKRNQLDAAVRLCIAAGLATVASIGLLLWDGPWLFLALVTYLLCWICYRAAVAAARTFSTSLAAAVDLHHLEVFDALQLERPANLAQEIEINSTLGKLFNGDRLDTKAKGDLHYVAVQADNRRTSDYLAATGSGIRPYRLRGPCPVQVFERGAFAVAVFRFLVDGDGGLVRGNRIRYTS